nr:uncharacterized protein LOC117446127 [Pseudochaenichthys georgianus]
MEDLWSSGICQKDLFASNTENIVAFDMCVATSSTVRIGWCGLFRAVFKSLGLMHILISCLSFLLVATIEDTQSVGSETGMMTPSSCILSSSALTLSFIATGMRCAGRTTGFTSGSRVMEYVTGAGESLVVVKEEQAQRRRNPETQTVDHLKSCFDLTDQATSCRSVASAGVLKGNQSPRARVIASVTEAESSGNTAGDSL